MIGCLSDTIAVVSNGAADVNSRKVMEAFMLGKWDAWMSLVSVTPNLIWQVKHDRGYTCAHLAASQGRLDVLEYIMQHYHRTMS